MIGEVPYLPAAVKKASQYWEQDPTEDPIYEVLLQPPVTVIEPIYE